MSDIVERLRAIADSLNEWDHPINGKADIADAIAEIERLRGRVAELEQTLDDYGISKSEWSALAPGKGGG